MTRLLDAYADVLPYGLQPTPFGEVWRALQLVASTVWDVDPAVYRAGIAWGWYVQRNPDALAAQRDLVIAALISEQAPLIKADQTTEELVEYLRQWREYRPTYDRLEAIYKLFAADVEILPVSTPGAPPVSDTRLAFYVRIYGVDFSRLLTLEEAYTIAIRATPLGSRPIVYYEFEEQLSVATQPLKAGIASINYENDAICEPVELNHYTFIVADATTGQIVSGFSNELVYGEIEGIILQPPRLVYGVDISVPTAQFWFTENGRDEAENTVLQPNSIVSLYDENGNEIEDRTVLDTYDGEATLAYMRANGDMQASPENEYLLDQNSVLSIDIGNDSAGSAWSVFAERVFTLSFANTQLPGVTITMPADETGHKGTSITLPTMTGEYESGGKTWTPSAWDIGAFGDSYTLNADIVAHLIFEEVQDQEIDIDVTYGDPVTIPAGYSIESVKSSVAYVFAQNANAVQVGSTYRLTFYVPGCKYYFGDTDESLLTKSGDPCLQLWQSSGKNDAGNYVGYWLSARSTQTGSFDINSTNCELNGVTTNGPYLMFYSGDGNSGSTVKSRINDRASKTASFALQMRRYDANNALMLYYFNVPKDTWRFIGGVFSWTGDTTSTSAPYGLSFWYNLYTVNIRIHCVPSPGPQLYQIAWMAQDKSNVYFNTGTSYNVFDDSGNRVPYDSTKSYTLLWLEDTSGTDKMPTNPSNSMMLGLTSQSGYLKVISATNGPTPGNVSKVYYTVTG